MATDRTETEAEIASLEECDVGASGDHGFRNETVVVLKKLEASKPRSRYRFRLTQAQAGLQSSEFAREGIIACLLLEEEEEEEDEEDEEEEERVLNTELRRDEASKKNTSRSASRVAKNVSIHFIFNGE